MGVGKRQPPNMAALFLLVLLALGGGCAGEPPGPVSGEATLPVSAVPSPVVIDPFEINARLGRGINLGNALEAPVEGEWGVVLREEYFDLIAEAGFDSVRIPIRWSAHAANTAPYTISPTFFARVDWAVEQALARGLLVVIDMHHYVELMEQPVEHRERFLALWEQIAAHYQGYPPELLFELLNEPSGRLTPYVWNPLLEEAIHVIRETNPQRILVVGPAYWNSVGALRDLELPPEDENLIVTFHYYEPFQFTHQGAEWVLGSEAWLGTDWRGAPVERRAIERDLDAAAAWAVENGRPLYMGEFGAYSRADIESRVLWTAFVAREAEERGMSWAYWEFCAGFGVYDPSGGVWNEPILEALIPPAP